MNRHKSSRLFGQHGCAAALIGSGADRPWTGGAGSAFQVNERQWSVVGPSSHSATRPNPGRALAWTSRHECLNEVVYLTRRRRRLLRTSIDDVMAAVCACVWPTCRSHRQPAELRTTAALACLPTITT